jgi:hypothetical protein
MKNFCMSGLFFLLTFTAQSYAQTIARSEWKFPTDAKSYCRNTEDQIMDLYRSMVQNHRAGADPQWSGDKRDAFEAGDAYKKALKEQEETWQRMDCAQILYGKK